MYMSPYIEAGIWCYDSIARLGPDHPTYLMYDDAIEVQRLPNFALAQVRQGGVHRPLNARRSLQSAGSERLLARREVRGETKERRTRRGIYGAEVVLQV